MTWIIAGFSLTATWLNIRKRRLCFAVWFGTNVSWAVVQFLSGVPARGVLDLIYAGLAVYGWIHWGKRDG